MKITMLGVGNGFSTGVYDNNALVEDGGQCALIDCGTTAWLSLEQLGRKREEIDSIFLTHLHFDHSGGVESAALYGKYVAGRKCRLLVPKPIAGLLWDGVLRGTIENKGEGLTALSDYFEVETPEEGETFTLCGGLRAQWFPTKHIAGKFSCGLLMDGRVVYTSDMKNDLQILLDFEKLGAQTIFHDCQLNNAAVHADFETMKGYPQHLQEKILLMHHGLLDENGAPESGKMRFLFQHRPLVL